MEWFSLLFEPLVFIGFSLLLIVLLSKLNVNVKYTFKLLYVVIIFYILVATPLGSNYLVSRVEITTFSKNCLNIGVNTVVILGGGITGDPDSIDEIWRLKEASYRRTLSGLALAKRFNINTIIVSGGYGGRFSEAHLMERLIFDIGYSGKVIIDHDSKNTYSSAVNLTKYMLDRQIDKYWLVTSAMHMHRAESVFVKQGMNPCRYPVNSKYVDTSFPSSLVPQISALDKSTAAFHEIVGYFWYTVSNKN